VTDLSRQILATYAFFEQSRQSSNSPQDSLLPFILPYISGRGDTLFTPDELATRIAHLFGEDAAKPIAQSMTDSLSRGGYIKRDPSIKDEIVYFYTPLVNEIPVDVSVSTAQRDLEEIMTALDDYMSATHFVTPIELNKSDLRAQFVDWATTLEISDLTPKRRSSLKPPAATKEQGHLELLFSAFVKWASRERHSVLDKVARFTELGLVIDLLSELRVPTRKLRQVSLAAILDSRLLLELLGLYGKASQASIERLLELCKKYGVTILTLSHLVDEVREISYNAINFPEPAPLDSVNEAMRMHPEVRELVKGVYAGPDTLIRRNKKANIAIVKYTHLHEHSAEQYFTDKDIRRFADALPYDKSKPNMALRDAWSLAYAVRRQNGAHTSNLYDSKCVILTRSPRFVSTARKFLREECGYPGYAVAPVVELRHFSTMFMLSYGVDVTRPVIRSELLAECDRVLSVSPDLTRKIRSVMSKWEGVPHDKIEAALEDPVLLSELAVATSNDPTAVTASNGAAIFEIFRTAGQKDAELRYREEERKRNEAHGEELERARADSNEKQKQIDSLSVKVFEQSERAVQLESLLESQSESNADVIVSQIIGRVDFYWRGVTIVVAVICLLLMLDMIFHFTEETSRLMRVLAGVLGLVVAYHTLIAFVPKWGPERARSWLIDRAAAKRLSWYSQSDVRDRVLSKLRQRHGE
jgi:hypothetical protein